MGEVSLCFTVFSYAVTLGGVERDSPLRVLTTVAEPHGSRVAAGAS